MVVKVLAFGPLAEVLGGREHNLEGVSTISEVLKHLGIEEWRENRLTVSIDGVVCNFDSEVSDGVEIALLPPVSGG